MKVRLPGFRNLVCVLLLPALVGCGVIGGLTEDAALSKEKITLQYGVSSSITVAVQDDLDLIKPTSELEGYSYSVSPSLPAGILLDADTGEISGSPLESVDLTTFTISARKDNKVLTYDIQLQVTSEYLQPSSLKYTGQTLGSRHGWGSVEIINDVIYLFGGSQQSWPAGQRKVSSAPVNSPMTWTNHGNLLPSHFGWGNSFVDEENGYLYGGVWSGKRLIYKFPVSNPLAIVDTTLTLPGDFTGGCTFELEGGLYFIGGGAASDEIWRADYSSPDVVSDTGVKLPTPAAFSYCYKVGKTLYFTLIGGYVLSTYTAQENLPLIWSLHGSQSVPENNYNGGQALIVGEYAYLLGGNGDNANYRVPIKDFQNWERLNTDMVAWLWGKNVKRVGDKVYFFGGNRSNYLGSDQIWTMDILPAAPAVEASDPGSLPIVLGQSTLNSEVSSTAVAANTLGKTNYSITSDGTRLFVSDYTNHRVLIWNAIPTNSNQPADVVVGQPNMTTATCNHGGTVTASTLCSPGGAFSDGIKMYVADYGNNRVLIWNTIPTADFAPANVVLGQPDMSSNTANLGSRSNISLSGPYSLIKIGAKLLVNDFGNHRILVWDTVPTVNRTAANWVIGQTAMNLGTDGYSSPSAANLSYPYQLATDGTKLFVADTGLNRVLIWNSVPAANGVGANTVIGQPDMATKDYRTASAQDFATPTSVAFGNGKLYVTDGDNSRILVWNSVPTGNYVAADGVHGQPVFSTIAPNSGGGVSKDSLATGPVGLFADSLRVFVGDPYNRRIKIIEHF